MLVSDYSFATVALTPVRGLNRQQCGNHVRCDGIERPNLDVSLVRLASQVLVPRTSTGPIQSPRHTINSKLHAYRSTLSYVFHVGFQAPEFVVTKKAYHTPIDQIDGYAAVGEVIRYEVVAKNTGNVDINVTAVTGTMFDSIEGSLYLK